MKSKIKISINEVPLNNDGIIKRNKKGQFVKGFYTGFGFKKDNQFSKHRKNKIPSKETREKMSIAKIGKSLSEEHKRKISISEKGKTISEKTKLKMSKKKKGIKLSEEHKNALKKPHPTMVVKMPKSMENAGKWGNVKSGYFDINGKEMFFRSKWEANYALYLDFLIKQKQIFKWEYESDTFIFEKIKFGTRSYRPDFKVYDNEKDFSYHEVKGYMDAKSKTKIKRMAKYYPEIKLIIIDKDVYKDIKTKLGKMLKFY